MDHETNGIRWTDDDVVNPDEYHYAGRGAGDAHPWLFHDHGFVLGVVFADNLQDALDEMVDNDKLDSFQIDEADFEEYGVNTDDDRAAYLGNASEPFDIESVDYVEMITPDFSLAALCKAHDETLSITHKEG